MGPSQTTPQLIACCEPQLETALYLQDPDIAQKKSEQVMVVLKRLAVINVALSTRRSALLNKAQDAGESVRQNVARLRGLALVCEWTKTASCSKEACDGTIQLDYTDEIVRMVLLNGLADVEIRKEVLGMTDIDPKTLADTVTIIDSKETAARALSGESPRVAASAYKKSSQPTRTALSEKTIRCTCGTVTRQFGRVRGRIKEFTSCLDCWRKNAARRRQVPAPAEVNRRDVREPEGAVFQYAASIDFQEATNHSSINSVSRGRGGFISINDHYVFDGTRGWRAGAVSPHPTLEVHAEVDTDAYDTLGLAEPPRRSADVSAVADSGAQTCLLGLPVLCRLGLRKQHLTRVTKRILAANSEEIHVLGAIFLRLTGRNGLQQPVTTSAMVYVTDSTDRFYLSRTVLAHLAVLSTDFPKVGSAVAATTTDMATCGCPQRANPPGRPARLPFEPVPENAQRMKSWLLERYAASTFNVCPHQPLSAMTGPSMALRVPLNLQPVATNRAPHVAVHWQQEVADQLERDVALGVIERVPPNTPVTWLHSMVVPQHGESGEI